MSDYSSGPLTDEQLAQEAVSQAIEIIADLTMDFMTTAAEKLKHIGNPMLTPDLFIPAVSSFIQGVADGKIDRFMEESRELIAPMQDVCRDAGYRWYNLLADEILRQMGEG